MNIKHKGLRALIALGGMTAAMAFTQLATPTAAMAYCDNFTPETLTLEIGGVVYASVTPKANSCENANGTYTATFHSHKSGWQAGWRYQDDGAWHTVWGPSSLASIEVSLYDENQRIREQLCVDNQDAQNPVVICGYTDPVTGTTWSTLSGGVTNTYSILVEGF